MRWSRLALVSLLAGLMLFLAEAPRGHSSEVALVYVTRTGHRYHSADCRYLSDSSTAMPLNDAIAAGYTPCKVCKPPVPPEDTPLTAPNEGASARGAASPALSDLTPVAFIRIVDGDTLHLRYRGRDTSVRLIGIDTPELHYRRGHPDYPEPYAKAAARYLARLVKGRRLFLETDVEAHDRYGRTLGYLWAQKEGDSTPILVNAQLLRAGLAQLLTIPPNVKYVERFVAAQREARNEGIGLWMPIDPPLPAS